MKSRTPSSSRVGPELQHYLPSASIRRLERDATVLESELAETARPEGEGVLWLVATTSKRGGFRTNTLGLGPVSEWVYSHCRLRRTIGVARLDFRQNELRDRTCSGFVRSER